MFNMSDVSDFVSDGNERTTEQEIGLIAGMMDGHIESFDFRGFEVLRVNGSMYVTDREMQRTLGGALHLEGASLQFAHDWLCRKAAHYDGDAEPEVVA